VKRGVQTEFNRKIRCLDNRPDISAHLFHPHDTVPGHRLEGTGKVAAAPSRRRFQLLERFGLTIQDGPQEQLVLVAEGLAILLPFTLMAAKGAILFVALGLVGMITISTFSLTVVMAQRLMPSNLGVASGLMVGFAIGAGGICVTFLGVLADHFGVPFALKSIAILPVIGLILCLILKYPEEVPGRSH
jgi:hypothetical protein